MQIRSKRIVSGILVVFIVLSVLGISYKLPNGGELLNFYNENLIFKTKNINQNTSTYSFATTESEKDEIINRGVLRCNFDFTGSTTNNFAINTILDCSGVKTTNGDTIKASDLTDKTSTNALQIKGGENFFKNEGETGAIYLIKFDISADIDTDTESSLAKAIKQLKYDVDRSEKYKQFYGNDDSYRAKLKQDNDQLSNYDLLAMKNEADRVVEIAKNCFNAIDKVDVEGKINKKSAYYTQTKELLAYVEIFINSVIYENNSFEVNNEEAKNIKNNALNVGRLLFAAIDSSVHVIQRSTCMVIKAYPTKLNAVKNNTEYEDVNKWYNTYTKVNPNKMVSDKKYGKQYALKSDQKLKDIYCYSNYDSMSDYEYTTLKLFVSKVAEVIPYENENVLFSLTLGENTLKSDDETLQSENTYQILETDAQKLYWEDSNLVFEIPIKFPKYVVLQKEDGTITKEVIKSFRASNIYKNPDYLETTDAS